MTAILERILAAKAQEVAAAQAERPLAALLRDVERAPGPRNFAAALAAGGRRPAPLAVIAEVKKASPSKGLIRPDFDPPAIARSYVAGGADALSVLTDAPFFQGSLTHLREVRAAVDLPLLRKDFTIDAYQLAEARAAGADAILLIVAAFTGTAATAAGRTLKGLHRLHRTAADLGLAALVEVHTGEELQVALELGAPLIGINNRNKHTFETRLDVTLRLAPQVPPATVLVSESGIGTLADLQQLAAAGARAVLVGESLMRRPDPAQGLRELLGTAS